MGSFGMKPYTEEEKAYIKENVAKLGTEVVSRETGRTEEAIRVFCKRNKIAIGRVQWREDEHAYLLKKIGTDTFAEIALALGKTESAVTKYANSHGLRRKDYVHKTPYFIDVCPAIRVSHEREAKLIGLAIPELKVELKVPPLRPVSKLIDGVLLYGSANRSQHQLGFLFACEKLLPRYTVLVKWKLGSGETVLHRINVRVGERHGTVVSINSNHWFDGGYNLASDLMDTYFTLPVMDAMPQHIKRQALYPYPEVTQKLKKGIVSSRVETWIVPAVKAQGFAKSILTSVNTASKGKVDIRTEYKATSALMEFAVNTTPGRVLAKSGELILQEAS